MTMMTELAMATEATLSARGKTDAFLNKISTPYIPVTEPTPEKPKLITRQEYWEDAKKRWEIHTNEIKDLINDCKWIIEKIKPYVQKVVSVVKPYIDKVVAWVQDIFNPDKKKTS